MTAQFRVIAATSDKLVLLAWNASWDVLLLSAFFRAEIGFNLQSDTTASEITIGSNLRATYDENTTWPNDFIPEEQGAVHIAPEN